MRAQVAPQVAADADGDDQRAEQERGVVGPVVARGADDETSSASATSISEIPRWKRPASECGQGSSGRTISRPRSESVQASLRGQPLQTCALAR